MSKLLFFISLSVVFGIHLLALYFELYWVYPWLDIPMHVFGGITIVLGLAAFFPRMLHSFLTPLLVVLGVSLLWEVFEHLIGFSFIEEAYYVFDTGLDFLMGILGGLIGYVLVKNIE